MAPGHHTALQMGANALVSRGGESEDPLEILGRIDVRTRPLGGVRYPDFEAILERTQLLEPLGRFQRGGRERGDF